MKLFKKRKVVLALGGGAARGLTNIGILKVFEQHFGRDNMPFDMVVGTSIGSLIGAGFCAGKSADEMKKLACKFDWPKLVDLGFNPTGFLKGDKLESLITDIIGDIGFPDLKIPFALTTTDIQTGEELVYTDGDLIRLLRASCSWPGVFSAVEHEGRLLADGGLRNSVPTKYAYESGATFVVAVNPGFAITKQKIDNAFKAIVQSIQIMGEELNAYQTRIANVAIKPVLREVDQFGFDQYEYIIRQGEFAAVDVLKELDLKLKLHKMVVGG